MQRVVQRTIYCFLAIFALTALLSLAGIVRLWAGVPGNDLPYLKWLCGSVIGEVVAVVVLLARKGLTYLPETVTNKTREQTLLFMEKFITQGSSVTIVSNRAGWLSDATAVLKAIARETRRGTRFEIISPQPLRDEVREALTAAGAILIVTGESQAPEARFTLINAERGGSEKLAIAKGGHPEHEIVVFDSNSGPQIIAMAKDIVRKSKELART